MGQAAIRGRLDLISLQLRVHYHFLFSFKMEDICHDDSKRKVDYLKSYPVKKQTQYAMHSPVNFLEFSVCLFFGCNHWQSM